MGFSLGLLMSGALLLYGVVNAETLLVMLGCFCVYACVASTIAGDDPVTRAALIALCGLVTMLLAEMVREYLVPFHNALSELGCTSPFCDLIFSGSSWDGLPFDVWLLRDALRDAVAAVEGDQRT